jgi:predicted neutral ceramidase superfamily lipid hydrolase
MIETVSSLQKFFLAVGLLFSFSAVFGLATSNISLTDGLVTFAFSAVYLYLGFMLPKFLVESPQIIINFLLALTAYEIITFVFDSLSARKGDGSGELALGLLLNWYLYYSVKRLSQ